MAPTHPTPGPQARNPAASPPAPEDTTTGPQPSEYSTGVTAIVQDWGDGDVQRILILAPDLRALIDALTHP